MVVVAGGQWCLGLTRSASEADTPIEAMLCCCCDELRSVYGSFVDEPMPEHLACLVANLDQDEQKAVANGAARTVVKDRAAAAKKRTASKRRTKAGR
jgi:hypothetical protein